MDTTKMTLGIEFGSTRIKAVAIDEHHSPVSSGHYTWTSSYENGIWTYSLDEVWAGLKAALSRVEHRETVCAMGVSAMMHGYLAFDKDWNLLTRQVRPSAVPAPQRYQDKHYFRKHGPSAYYGQG